jgi:hypothetical protein
VTWWRCSQREPESRGPDARRRAPCCRYRIHRCCYRHLAIVGPETGGHLSPGGQRDNVIVHVEIADFVGCKRAAAAVLLNPTDENMAAGYYVPVDGCVIRFVNCDGLTETLGILVAIVNHYVIETRRVMANLAKNPSTGIIGDVVVLKHNWSGNPARCLATILIATQTGRTAVAL